MYAADRKGSCRNSPADTTMLNIDTDHDSTHYLIPMYYNVNEQSRRWQNEMPLNEPAPALPKCTFTQVTIPGNERRKSRHGGSDMTHHGSNAQRKRGDLVRSPTCHGETQHLFQYNDMRTHSCSDPAEPTSAIHATQCSAAMLLDAYTYSSGGHQHQPSWAAYRVEDQTNSFDYSGAFFSPVDVLSQYIGLRLPPTPTGTVGGDEAPSVTSDILPLTSSPECEGVRSRPYAAEPADSIRMLFQTGKTASEGQHSKTLATPPPERVAASREHATQRSSDQPLDTQENIKTKSDEDEPTLNEATKTNGAPSAVPVTEENLDLNFLPGDWDPSSFDFLDDPNGFAPAFMSDQGTSWDTRQDSNPSAHLTLPLDSEIAAETGSNQLQENSSLPLDTPLDFQFNQYNGYHSTESPSSYLDTFQNTFPTFQTHGFAVQPASASLTSDRTSHRSTNKDQLLVELKQKGYSYKDIKMMGQFGEAESTLRGRYRTLTKPKEARVRKPEWGDREIGLLLQAVAAHTNFSDDNQSWSNRSTSTMSRRASKIPWKQVAQYMALRGAYKYGNATAKKKWTEVMAAGSAQ